MRWRNRAGYRYEQALVRRDDLAFQGSRIGLLPGHRVSPALHDIRPALPVTEGHVDYLHTKNDDQVRIWVGRRSPESRFIVLAVGRWAIVADRHNFLAPSETMTRQEAIALASWLNEEAT